MHTTIELARLAMQERERQARREGLRALAQRVAACCRQAPLLARLAAAVRGVGDSCCPSGEEQLARAVGTANGG